MMGAPLFIAALVVSAATPTYVDPLDVAARLVSVGAYADALDVLSEPEPAQPDADETTKTSRMLRRATLTGVASLRSGAHAEAKRALLSATRIAERGTYGSADRALYVTLADAAFGADDCPLALQAFRVAAPLISERRISAQSDCYQRLGRTGLAYRTLAEGADFVLTADRVAHRQLVFLLERGLFRAAFDAAKTRIMHQSIESALFAVDAFAQHSAFDAAVDLALRVEAAHPQSHLPRVLRARVLADSGKLFAAARMYETLATLHPEYATDAAEVYRRARRFQKALYWNRRVPDDAARMRQRFGLLVQMGQLHRAAGMLDEIERGGLLGAASTRAEQTSTTTNIVTQKTLHAAAFVALETDDFARARRLAGRLSDHKLRAEFTFAIAQAEAATRSSAPGPQERQ